MKSLTQKQTKFVLECLKDGNAFQAALRAGYKDGSTGRKLTTKKHVSAEIQKFRKKAEEHAQINLNWALSRLVQLVDFDPRKLFDDCGRLIAIKDLPDDVALSLKSVKVTSDDDGEKTLEATFHDRKTALDSIIKMLGGFREQYVIEGRKTPIKLDPLTELLDQIDGATRGLPNLTQRKSKEIGA